jgi:ribosomal protein S18 acetylase RimI-like enzyme
MITHEDWRDTPPEEIAGLYDRECRRFAALGWDYRPSCEIVESARTSGRLPGLVARDGRRRIVGWTYFLLQQTTLQIGALLGDGAAIVRGLLAATLQTPDGQFARHLSCFLFPGGPAVESALVRLRFAVDGHQYLMVPLADPLEAGGPAVEPLGLVQRPWAPRDLPELVRVLAAAYNGLPEARCFAPNGRTEEWARYLAQLVQTPACGRFDPAMTATAWTAQGRLAGLVIVTALADRTAHIAQVAVAPTHRRQGLGEALVRLACDRARRAGHDQMTLLVDESNGPARRLYARLGFEPAARFLFAYRVALRRAAAAGAAQPWRSSSEAAVSGGAMTRR